MRSVARLILLTSASLSATPVFGPQVNGSDFAVTVFASGLSFPQSIQKLPDNSIVVQTSPSFSGGDLLRFSDLNFDGIADGPGTSIYTAPANQGPLTQLVQAGSYLIQGNYGAHSIVILQPGATPASQLTEVARMEFGYPGELWWHDTIGLAVRPTPGQPGSYDLIFNVGSQFDNIASIDTVSVSNLVNASLNPDSLYMVTLNLSGPTPVASNLRQVASGIRNVFGMGFDENGNFWFSENAMDGNPFPPQAEELNRILADTLNKLQAGDINTAVPNFGFPTCFPDYFTGVIASPGCTAPVVAFTPLTDAFSNLMYSQGATQIAFAPPDFPAPYNHGIFIAFSAGNGRNPVIFYNLDTGLYEYFLLGDAAGMRRTGLLSTNNALFLTNFTTGEVLQFTSAVPEPATFLIAAIGLAGLAFARRSKQQRQ